MTKIKRADILALKSLANKINDELAVAYYAARKEDLTSSETKAAKERMLDSRTVIFDLRHVESILDKLEALE